MTEQEPVREGELPHLRADGRARMVDVGDKPITRRVAVASGKVHMNEATLVLIAGEIGAVEDWQKGVVYAVLGIGAAFGAWIAPGRAQLPRSG